MSWNNVHKWVVRYSDDINPKLEHLERYTHMESIADVTDTGSNVLHFAAVGQQAIIAKYLLDNVPKFLINQANDFGETPFHWACQAGNADIVSHYLKAGAFVNCKDEEGDTPLHYAARAGHLKVVKLLFKQVRKPSLNAKNLDGDTPLMLACEDRNSKVIQFLISQGAKYHELLCHAVETQDKYTVRKIVAAVKTQSEPACADYNPLHLAVKNNHYKIAKLLVDVEAWIQGKNHHGKTPAELLDDSSDKRLRKLLLKH